jgi:hypothetical protein
MACAKLGAFGAFGAFGLVHLVRYLYPSLAFGAKLGCHAQKKERLP